MSHFHRSPGALHSGELAGQPKVVKTVHTGNLITCVQHQLLTFVSKPRAHTILKLFVCCIGMEVTGVSHSPFIYFLVKVIFKNSIQL